MHDTNVGHLSLSLSDGTYISHWPDGGAFLDLKKQNGRPMRSLKDDIRNEGGEPTETLNLPNGIVDENKIKIWWNQGVKDGTQYNMVHSNCGQMVRTALIRGGIKEPMSYESPGGNPLEFMITPYRILHWIKECVDLHRAGRNPFYIGNWFKK